MKLTELAFAVRRANPELRPDASSLSKVERGLSHPGADLVGAIAAATGHAIDFFYEAGGDVDEEEEAALPSNLVDALRPLARLVDRADARPATPVRSKA